MALRVTHIHLSGFELKHEAISSLRWRNDSDNSTGESSKATLVDWIDGKKETVYVQTGGKTTYSGTVHRSGGTPYLRTYADGEWNYNMLLLPQF